MGESGQGEEADVTQRMSKEQGSHLTVSHRADWAGLAVGKSSSKVRALGSRGVPFPPPRGTFLQRARAGQGWGLLPLLLLRASHPQAESRWAWESGDPSCVTGASHLASDSQLLQPGKGGGVDSDCLAGLRCEARNKKVPKILLE